MAACPSTLEKQPAESILYNMVFAARLDSGEIIDTVDSVVADPATGIVLGAPQINVAPLVLDGVTYAIGTVVQVRLSSGDDGVTYKITIVVTTDQTNTIEEDGFLAVVDV